MQVCCRLHLSTRGSESVTESGKDGVRLSLFLERQGGSFTSFHSQTKVSIRFPFFLLVPICPASALLACVCFLENIRTRLAAQRQHRRKVHQPGARSFQWTCFVLVRLKFRPGCADMYTKLYILTGCLPLFSPAPNPIIINRMHLSSRAADSTVSTGCRAVCVPPVESLIGCFTSRFNFTH